MSLTFERITDATARRIVELRAVTPSELSEFSLAYTFHWQSDDYFAEFAEVANCGVLRFTYYGHHYYSLPFGPGDHADAQAAIRAAESGRLMLGLLTETEAASYAADGWLVRENGWGFDYVYKTSDLAELKGTKYQAKRNFCRRFEKAGDWHYGPLERKTAAAILEAWRIEKADAFDTAAQREYRALTEDLKTATLGGILYQGERPVAFAVGERLSPETLLVAYEKALSDVTGAFQMINREFARREGAGYTWLNRASADGYPALEKAKESYYPARRLKKFFAIDPRVRGTDLKVRRIAPADLTDIVPLWQGVFGATEPEPFIREIAEENPGYVIVDAQGLAAMGFALPREGARYVYALATRPDCRGQGLAIAILETIALDFPAETLALVPGDPSLIPFYEKRGFAVSSTQEFVTMTCPLSPGYVVPNPMY